MSGIGGPDPFDFGPGEFGDDHGFEGVGDLRDAFQQLLGDAPRPINWSTLEAEDAEAEWLELNQWVNWLRREYGLPAAIVPPLWHRHPELVWELSALHLAWVSSYDPQQAATAPLAWHRDFQLARERLREWTAVSGTKLDRDRPTRQTAWPGEPEQAQVVEHPITNRDDDFVQFVRDDVQRRAEPGTGGGGLPSA
jgi:hypothetical protein